MKREDVPQDESSALAGQKKPLYVVNAEGEYVTELSSGWDAEEVVLSQAIEQFELQAIAAHDRARNGHSAPLEYHMYQARMDISVLSQSTGFFKWQIRRHMRPAIFTKLSEKKLTRYCDALGLSLTQLRVLPKI